LRSVLRACHGGDVDDRAELHAVKEQFIGMSR
jgi:hypothetical protein